MALRAARTSHGAPEDAPATRASSGASSINKPPAVTCAPRSSKSARTFAALPSVASAALLGSRIRVIIPARDWTCHESRDRMSARIGSWRFGNQVASMRPSASNHRGIEHDGVGAKDSQTFNGGPKSLIHPGIAASPECRRIHRHEPARIWHRIIELNVVDHGREARIAGREVAREFHRLPDARRLGQEAHRKLEPGLARLFQSNPL